MTALPRWMLPSPQPADSAEQKMLIVTVSGDGGTSAARRVMTAVYLWARHAGVPPPELGKARRYGPHVAVPFRETPAIAASEQAAAEIRELFDSGGGSTLLGANDTGAHVREVWWG
ncbi:hypothetical protein [Dietzia sp. 179-F 9C3 NHS]|uniref:hypothetical protein n=1 Tax=Dietzia sp. 179-F 9C3 NHS TaxID=3374295 RepID=UPI00387A1DC5